MQTYEMHKRQRGNSYLSNFIVAQTHAGFLLAEDEYLTSRAKSTHRLTGLDIASANDVSFAFKLDDDWGNLYRWDGGREGGREVYMYVFIYVCCRNPTDTSILPTCQHTVLFFFFFFDRAINVTQTIIRDWMIENNLWVPLLCGLRFVNATKAILSPAYDENENQMFAFLEVMNPGVYPDYNAIIQRIVPEWLKIR